MAGLQGMARNQMSARPLGPLQGAQAGLGGRSQHRCSGQALGAHREMLPGQSTAWERWTLEEGLGGALLESSDTLALPQAQALDTFLDPTLFKNRKAEGEAWEGSAPPHPSPESPPPQWKPGRWGGGGGRLD